MAVITSKQYITVYNALQAIEWINLLLLRTVRPLIEKHGCRLKFTNKQVIERLSAKKPSLWTFNGKFLKTIQTLQLLESVHVITGITPNSSLSTTLGQTLGRMFITYFIGDDLPNNDLMTDIMMFTLQVSWALADIIRYSHYISQTWELEKEPKAAKLVKILKFLRYNAFLILYPVGMLSEIGLVLRVVFSKWLRSESISTLPQTNEMSATVAPEHHGVNNSEITRKKKLPSQSSSNPYPLYKKILVLFFFGFIVAYGYPSVFSHMLKQRTKHMTSH
ncbi:hypothetical protein C9374_011168 [Naegleria lovaniensis]|uniref:very-long-chain (3R)-3-hydroxyacyl-CoA dehydratase n=1 Tax=Naegleria lovaniensis TaxID=51637 RepID=A0AA88KEY5_NAELO|nr:uncharacterized protein C9374_011168 [Naegleria lovaniensis]KAG2374089.1 hypothetical protein C9374_011168 [Naegleria lovaniensis]